MTDRELQVGDRVLALRPFDGADVQGMYGSVVQITELSVGVRFDFPFRIGSGAIEAHAQWWMPYPYLKLVVTQPSTIAEFLHQLTAKEAI